MMQVSLTQRTVKPLEQNVQAAQRRPKKAPLVDQFVKNTSNIHFSGGFTKQLYPKARLSFKTLESELTDREEELSSLQTTKRKLEQQAKPAEKIGEYTSRILKLITRNHQEYSAHVKGIVELMLAGDLPKVQGLIDKARNDIEKSRQELNTQTEPKQQLLELHQKLDGADNIEDLAENELFTIANGFNTSYQELAEMHEELLNKLKLLPGSYRLLEPQVPQPIKKLVQSKMKEGVQELTKLTADTQALPVRQDALMKLALLEQQFDPDLPISSSVYPMILAEKKPALVPVILKQMAAFAPLRKGDFNNIVIDQFTRGSKAGKSAALDILATIPIDSWLVDEELSRILKSEASQPSLKEAAEKAVAFRKEQKIYRPPIQANAPNSGSIVSPSQDRELRKLALAYKGSIKDFSDPGPNLILYMPSGSEEQKQQYLNSLTQRIFPKQDHIPSQWATVDLSQNASVPALHQKLQELGSLKYKMVVIDKLDSLTSIPNQTTQSNLIEYLKSLTGKENPIDGLSLKDSVFVFNASKPLKDEDSPLMPALLSRLTSIGKYIDLAN